MNTVTTLDDILRRMSSHRPEESHPSPADSGAGPPSPPDPISLREEASPWGGPHPMMRVDPELFSGSPGEGR